MLTILTSSVMFTLISVLSIIQLLATIVLCTLSYMDLNISAPILNMYNTVTMSAVSGSWNKDKCVK